MAAAGSVAKLQELEKKLNREIDNRILDIADCIALGAIPEIGTTREEACSAAIKAYKKYHNIA
jgi:hypothetical protein